ncbi:LacI family DNA-binding transcriptional regulator [Microbacterium sp. NPDC078428]|uniref:LacI family DNA-binding transcriptional regulator n=1 Tax=Microbacterium sp. NPDC078428 TaxID=3364190 RepID=UPI0037C5DD14
MTNTPRPKLADVARVAGVSTGTASKALTGRGALRRDTRERVLAAAEKLGYEPNVAALGLVSGRSYTVGLITSDQLGRFSVPVMLGAEDSLATGQMAILFCDAREDPVRERHWIRTLSARNVDGILVTSLRSDPRPSLSDLVSVPVVYAYSPSERPDDISVVPDDAQGGRLAGDHLLEVGRTRLAYVGGPASYTASHLRLRGFREALAAAGLDLTTAPLFVSWEEEAGRQAARMLLRRGDEFDGVFCASDQIARGLIDELSSAGVSVPDDVAVVGFDNWDIMTLASRPPITSIDMNLTKVGDVAARLLTEAIAGEASPGEHRVECTLIVRGSTV